MNKLLFKKFTLMDLIVIAMMAALGIAVKVVLVPLVHIITGPLFIPGGSISGGIYMMFIVLGAMIVKKRFAAFMVCLVQAVVITVTGSMGSHGIMSMVTYLLPGIGVEILYFIIGKFRFSKGGCFSAGVVANMLGTFGVNFVFFRLPLIPMLLTLCLASLTGGLGGLLSYAVSKQIDALYGGRKTVKLDPDIDISKSGDPRGSESVENKLK